jgi:hypothetical protein
VAEKIITYTASKTARKFHNSKAFVRGIMGPVGSGKSVACCMELFKWAQEQQAGPDGFRKSRFLVVRNTLPQLETTTIKTWVDWFPPSLFGRMTGKPPYTHYINYGDVKMEVIFIALDKPEDVKKLLSFECTGIWFNEAREIEKEIVDAGTGRVGRYPSKKDGGCTRAGIIMDTNPPSDDHWWYNFAEEDVPNGYEFFRQPGGLTAEAENVENLPDGYYEKMMAGKDQEWINVYVHGNYGFISDGKPIYNQYKDDLHFSEKVIYNHKLPLYIGLDFGLTPAAIFLQKDVLDRWAAIDELVLEDAGAKTLGRVLRAKIQAEYPNKKIFISGDPAGEQRSQTDEKTPFEMLKSEGIHAKPAPTNDFAIRVESVNTPLGRLIDGVPGLVIGPKCKVLRKAMGGGYKYRKLNVSGGAKYSEKPDKNKFSHPAEALQYGLLGGGEGKVVIRSYNPNKNKRSAYSSADYNELTY